MPELWIFWIKRAPVGIYPYMKFHINSISWIGVIAIKNMAGKVWREKHDRQDRWTDDEEVIP